MVPVDAGYSAWLKADALTVAVATAGAARWPTQGAVAAGLSPFVTTAGAVSEAQRRGDFQQAPTVRDRLVVDGEARALIGQCIEPLAEGLDYVAGEVVYVLRVEEQANNTSILTVLRRLQ